MNGLKQNSKREKSEKTTTNDKGRERKKKYKGNKKADKNFRKL